MDNGSNIDRLRGDMAGTGYLIVRASTAGGALPLEGALVTVRGNTPENSDIIYSVVTNSDGLTQKLSLPAPSKENSEKPGGAPAFSTYNIDVFLKGYYNQFFANVPIFDTITSVQPASMIPVAQNKYSDSFSPYDEIFNESENPDL